MKFIDLSGQKFGRLTVTNVYFRKNSRIYWKCICDCGNTSNVIGTTLRTGRTKSCGCLFREKTIEANTTHDMSYTLEYGIYKTMLSRCKNKSHNRYELYGGRGIKVCNRWSESFENFIEDMGLRPSKKHSIDRINPNGDYSPRNCRWADNKTQARNHRPAKRNAFGVTGLYFRKNGKIRAGIRVDGKQINLGTHSDLFEAICARKSAEIKYNWHEF